MHLPFRLMNNLVTALLMSLVLGAISPGLIASAFSQSLVITDCQGFTRAVKDVEPGSSNKVEIELNQAGAPAESAEATLTNSVTGEVTAALSKKGLVTFENISSGTYALNITDPNNKAGFILIAPMGVSGGLATTVGVITGVVGAGAAVGIGVAIEDEIDDSDSNDPPSGSGPNPQEPEEPAPQPGPNPTPQPTPIPTPDPFPCDPDEEPPPLDSFF